MITHDLGVVAEIADEVVVMYAARIVERAPAKVLFERPEHPYTWGLMRSLPRSEADGERLVQIPGQPPSLLNPPTGCRFHPRCAVRRCSLRARLLPAVTPGRCGCFRSTMPPRRVPSRPATRGGARGDGC